MAKICPKCGREFENSRTRCPICKIDLVSDGIDNSDTARMERLERLRRQQTIPQKEPSIGKQTGQTVTDRKSRQTEAPAKDGPSGLSITALVFSLLGCLSIVGLILGIIDLCVNKHRKKICSTLALVFSGLWIFGISVILGESGNSQKADTAKSVTSQTPSQNTGTTNKESKYFEDDVEEVQPVIQNTPKPADKKEYANSETEFDYDDMRVRYVSHEIKKNDYGDSCLVIYFEFTNNSDENRTFIYSFNTNVFQNGMALENCMIFTNDTCRNRNNEIQPGTTITLACDYSLRGDMNNVTLQVEPWISFSENILMELELSLQ